MTFKNSLCICVAEIDFGIPWLSQETKKLKVVLEMRCKSHHHGRHTIYSLYEKIPNPKKGKGKRKLGKAKNAKCHLSWNYHQMLPPIWSREIGKRWDAKWTPSDSLCDSSSSSSSSTSPVIMKMRTCQKIKHTLCLLPFTVFGIPSKVSFNITSEASYVYILSERKFIKNAKNWVTMA